MFISHRQYRKYENQKARMQKVMLHAYRDIDFLLKEGFDTNVDDCEMDGVKDTIQELKKGVADYIEETDSKPNTNHIKWKFR